MDADNLTRFAIRKMSEHKISARHLDESDEIVIFGSRSAGLERPNSDIDILCIGRSGQKLKTASLDLIVVHPDEVQKANWLGNELASHIARYGTWMKGNPEWVKDVRIGSAAVDAKQRRIAAFLRALPARWENFDDSFRQKYTTKLRREPQRLLLLARGIAIPPTRVLDESWSTFSIANREVEERVVGSMRPGESRFRRDLLDKIMTALDDQKAVPIPFQAPR